jgi:predicted dehydrogenase
MSTNKPTKFGIIGAGAIAQAYAQAFQVTQCAELVAAADIDLEAAKAISSKGYSSADEMVENEALDAVLVCTPPNTHPEIVTAMLKRGLHVLCEKPFCISSAEAERMVATAKQEGRILTMASKFRYVNDVRAARELVLSGKLGEVILFENAFTGAVDMRNRWNSVQEVSGGGVLIDNGTHSVDMIRYFLGPIDEVHAVEGRRTQGLDVDETVHLFVRNKQGVMGSIDLSWSISKELDTYISVYCTGGTIKLGWREAKYKDFETGEWTVFGKGYDKVQAFSSQLDNFAHAIRGEDELLISPEEGIESVRAVEACYASLKAHQWTPVA